MTFETHCREEEMTFGDPFEDSDVVGSDSKGHRWVNSQAWGGDARRTQCIGSAPSAREQHMDAQTRIQTAIIRMRQG